MVRTSSLYFHKARALRLTSALLSYSVRSQRHRYECTQFTIRFLKEIKKLVSRALFSYISTGEFLRTLEKCKRHSPSARASPCLYNSTMHSARFLFFKDVHGKKNAESPDRRNFEGVRGPFVINLHSCYNFARVLHWSAIVFSQSEARKFFLYIINWIIRRGVYYFFRNSSAAFNLYEGSVC